MIRINRLIKKSSIYNILTLPHGVKVELHRSKANQKDPNKVRVYIYLSHSVARTESGSFKYIMSNIINRPNIDDRTYCTVKTAIQTGFIRESVYNTLCVPMDTKYKLLCEKYNQEFFDKL
jgi:hypothetical protein